MKVIKSLENRGILLKETTEKIINKKKKIHWFINESWPSINEKCRHVLTPLAKSVLLPLGPTAATSATDATIHKKSLGSCTTLIISNE